MDFQFNLPVNLMFGRGKVAKIGKIAAKYGKKALIVTGKNSTKKSGLLDRTIELLKQSGVESVVFDKVRQNPLTTTATKGAEFAKAENCDIIIGLGGGSIMDCAKAIAFLAENDGDINDFIFNRKSGKKALPLILVPTTCGTGSEGNGFAVLTNPENRDKKSLRCNAIIPDVSIIDSELMQTMPKHILSSVCFDALCHSMEAYLAKSCQPMTEYMALSAIELIGKNLEKIYSGCDDADLWDSITWASTLGGMVIYTAGVALPHGMEHPASGLKDIVHGRGLAALTPVITDASIEGAPEKYCRISQLLGGSSAAECGDAIRKLLEKIDLNVGLKEQGISSEDIPWMTENCFRVSSASVANHPVTFDYEQIAKLYEKAL
ncbi:MAG: iron-containing alcohol dehydrogenase [Ruminococcus sp.]